MNISPLPYVASMPLYPPGRPISAVAREFGLDPASIIKLASNENPCGCSPAASAAITREAGNVSLYPDFDCYELYEALAKKLNLPVSQIVLGAGSSELIQVAVRAFIGPGDKAVMPQYSFVSYAGAVQSVGGESIVVPNNGWQPDLKALLKAVDEKVRVVFLTSPNNPTGIVVPREDILRFAAALPPRVLLVLDNAYYEYLKPDAAPSIEELLRSRENILVLRTFSKIYGLSGLRVGYGIARNALINVLRRLVLPFSVNSLAQAAAVAALDDDDFVRKSFAINASECIKLQEGFDRFGLEYVPSYANFVLVKTGDGVAMARALMQRGIIVRPVANYGLSQWLRITIGLPEQNDMLLIRMAELVASASAA